jgi:hypothetical protein
MKKLMILPFLSFSFAGADAQHHAIGLRTGASLWSDVGIAGSSSGSWDQQVFFRRETKGKMVFDFSLGHYQLNHDGEASTFFTPPTEYQVSISEKTRNFELNLSAQYDVSCSFMKSIPALSKLKSYAGITISPTLTISTAEVSYKEPGNDRIGSVLATKDAINIWTGINHSFVYDIAPNLYVITFAVFQIDPYKLFEKSGSSGATPDTRLGMQLGLGYQF